jgi:rRNA maturation RNase YbeY
MADARSVNKIYFHYLYTIPWFRNRTLLKKFISSIFQSEKQPLDQVHVIFCSDDYLLKINEQYLNHTSYTDIITFDLSRHPRSAITGEIYISVDRIIENASTYDCSLKKELHRVLFHGVLHLCGYDDKSSMEKKVMRSKEDHYLKKYSRYVPRETGST